MNNDIILGKILISKNCPNILMYGYYGLNKKEILINKINELYNLNKSVINNIKDDEIIYKNNDIYYEFDDINKNYEKYIKIIKEICASKNYYSKIKRKIIILNNFNLSTKKQNILRVIIEKYQITSIFIIITNNYSNISEPIKSRCLSLRIPVLSKKEKRKKIYEKISYKKMNPGFYDVIYDINDINTLNDTLDIKYIYDHGFINIYKKISERIINLFDKKFTLENYKDIRDISYNIIKSNIEINLFYYVFLGMLLKKTTLTDKIKKKFIYLFSESQYNYIRSYRSIIIIESLIFNTYNIYLSS